MKKMIAYYHAAKEELFKVVFPTKEQIRNALISVVVVVFIVALFLGLVDLILFASVTRIL